MEENLSARSGMETARTRELRQTAGGGTFLTGGLDVEHRETRYHRKADEVSRVESELQKVKDSYNDRVRTLKEKETVFLARQQKTIANIDKFKNYIYDTDKKRKSCEKRLGDKRRLGETKDKEITELKERLRKIQVLNSQLDQSIENVKSYEEFLDETVGEEDSVSNKDELIARYLLLKDTNRISAEKRRSAEAEILKVQKETHNLDKVKQNEILMKKHKVTKLRENIEQIASKSSNTSEVKEQQDANRRKLLQQVTALRHAVFNLHVLALNSYPVPKETYPYEPSKSLSNKTQRERTDIFYDHVKTQLKKIKDRLVELRLIVPKSMMEEDDNIFIQQQVSSSGGSRHRKGRGRKMVSRMTTTGTSIRGTGSVIGRSTMANTTTSIHMTTTKGR